jgi:hypothetical protein
MQTQTGTTTKSTFSPADLAERTIYRRAVEAAIWGMPLVAFDAMRQAFPRDAGAKYNDVVYWSRQADWKVQVTTPNASSWYVYIAINTKDGPVVLDVPPAAGAGLFGSMNDSWQIPQADVGPTGEDQGKDGKYLLLPPGYKDSVPDGYFPVRFNTYNGYSILRAIPVTMSDADVAKALGLVKKTRMYLLAQPGFWSISLYNADGRFVKNNRNAYTLNNTTAKKNPDGSVTVQFGGCDGKISNCLPIVKNWNYLVRLYRPHKEILDGTWKFPEAEPAS